MDIVQEKTIDLLDQQGPSLSSTSDMPVVETKPDSVPEKKAEQPQSIETTAEQPGESATPATEEEPGQQSEDEPRGVGKALAKLRQEKREAEERERQTIERLEKAMSELERFTKAPAPADPDPEPVRPTRAEFPDPEAYELAIDGYIESKAAWVAKREVLSAQKKAQEEAETRVIEERQRVAREQYMARVEKVKERNADFDEYAHSPDVQVPMPVAHAIINHEMGPELQYYFGKNPDEAARLMKLDSPQLQLMELGFIAAKLKNAPVAEKPKVSAAPKPIAALKGAGDTVHKSPEEESMEEYAARRQRELRSSARH